MNKQYDKAIQFRELHNKTLFILPNAWNGGSAKIFHNSDFDAIGTTSAGIAYSMGYPDGEKVSFEDIVRVTKEIINITDLPLSVDLERGFAETNTQLCKNVEEIISAGAVGINIEDGNPITNQVDNLDFFIKKIKSISSLRKSLKVPFFINARTDLFLMNTIHTDELIKSAIERASLLKSAGADCIFIPGPLDLETIKTLRANINLPINLYLHPKFSDFNTLSSIGINRLSTGSSPVRATLNELINFSKNIQTKNFDSVLSHEFSYQIANQFFR